MKVIDILIMRSKNEDMPKEIIVKGKFHHYEFKKENDINYIDNEGDYLFSREYNWFNMLNYDIEIIEEPKEELEELEEMEYAKAGDLMITIINELIKNQNMIIRKLKANKKQ